MGCAKDKSLRIGYHLMHLLQLAVLVQWIENLKFMEIVFGHLLGLVCPEAIGDQGGAFLYVLAAEAFDRFRLEVGHDFHPHILRNAVRGAGDSDKNLGLVGSSPSFQNFTIR